MKKWLALGSLVFLVACGGGGGGTSASLNVWPAASISSGTSVVGALSAQDIAAPDGSFVDLYTLDLADATEVRIRMESATFDTYLFLLQGADLADPNLLQTWQSHLIAENDDFGGTTTDSEIVITLAAGSYVIAANSFDAATAGSYTLTVATLTTNTYLQYRTVENPAGNRFAGWIEFLENGQLIDPNDILSIQLFDPNGLEVFPAATPSFFTSAMTLAQWNDTAGQFEGLTPFDYSGFSFDLSNQSALAAGTYTYVVQPVSGVERSYTVSFPGQTVLTPIVSVDMSAQWNLDGSLTLGWTEPAETFEQVRIIFYDANGKDFFNGRVAPGVGQVTLSASLIDQLAQSAQLALPTTVLWRMHTRSYAGDNNFTRSISNPVPIAWP